MHAAARLSLAAIALFTLVACGGGSSAPEDQADTAADKAAATELGRDTDATVIDDMIQTEDKARAVEGVTMEHKQDLDRALEAAAGDSQATDEH